MIFFSDQEIFKADGLDLNFIEIMITKNKGSNDSENYITITMKNKQKLENIDHKKEYDIETEVASYTIETQKGFVDINTMCDGSWGTITAYYTKDKISGLELILEQPSDIYSLNDFLKTIETVFGIEDIEWCS